MSIRISRVNLANRENLLFIDFSMMGGDPRQRGSFRMVRKAVENVQLLCFSGRDLSFDTFLRDNYRESSSASQENVLKFNPVMRHMVEEDYPEDECSDLEGGSLESGTIPRRKSGVGNPHRTLLRSKINAAAASPPGSGAYHIRGIEGVAGGHGMDCPAAGAFGLKCFHFELPRTASADNLQGDRQKLIRETHHSHFIHYLIGRAEAGRTSVMHI
jgi:hypothetical protein